MTHRSQTPSSGDLPFGVIQQVDRRASNDALGPSEHLPPYPYPGLRPFQFSESEIFFGRGDQVAEMLTRLEDHQFLAVVGASGCGKSSLVRAGLLPALEQGFLAASSDQWRFAIVRPGDAPLRNLACELLRALGPRPSHDTAKAAADEPDPHRVAMVQAALRSGPRGLVQVVEDARLPKDTNLLVLVDQFEELFRFRHRQQLDGASAESSTANERDEAAALVSLLLATAAQGDVPIYVVITMRSDFLGDCDAFYGLPEAINDSQFLTPRMTRAQARDAIVEPARLFGGDVEPALVNRILNEIGNDPDQLPLMQHALMRSWRHREKERGRPVTIQLADYEKLGGLKEALSRHADDVLKSLSSDADRCVAEMLFRALCDRSTEQRLTRRLATVAEIAAIAGVTDDAVIRVADAFRQPGRSFLTPPPKIPLTADSTLDISHESLIRQWGTLQIWLEREERSAQIYRRLAETARLWQAGEANLYRPPELDVALKWKQEEQPTIAWANRYARDDFDRTEEVLSRSQEAELERQNTEERQRRKRRRSRWLVAGGIALAIVGVLSSTIVLQRKEYEIARQRVEITVQKREVLEGELANKNTRVTAETRERLHGNALDSLAKGDLPGAMLWLEGRSKIPNLSRARASESEEKIRQLARIQLPNLQILDAFAPEMDGIFTDIALSAGERYLAAIEQARSRQSEGNETKVKIYSLANPSKGSHLVASFSLAGNATSRPSMAFAALRAGASETEYVLVGADQLYAWKRDGEVWTKVGVQPLANSNTPINSLAVGGDSLALTVHQESRQRRLRLWKLAPDSDTGNLQLNALPDLDGLSGKNVQSACLSSKGHVLAVCGEGENKATELMAWLKHPNEDRWGLASPPESVKRLTSRNTQRLYNWQWRLTENDHNWKRVNSLIRAVSFAPSGSQFATACDDGQVLIWDLAQSYGVPEEPAPKATITPQFETALQMSSSVFDIAFATDDVIITGGRDRTARLWDIHTTGEILPRTYHEATVSGVAFAGPGSVITNTLRVLRLWRAEEYERIRSPFTAQQVAMSDDKSRVIYLVNDSRGRSPPPLLHSHVLAEQEIRSTIISSDGNWIFTASRVDEGAEITMDIRAWEKNERPLRLKAPRDLHDIPLAAFSASGDSLAVAETNRSESSPRIFLWSLKAGSPTEVEPRNLTLPPKAVSESTLTFKKTAFGRFGDEDIFVVVGKEDLASDELPRGIVFFGFQEQEDDQSTWMLRRVNINAPRDSNAFFPHEQEVLCSAFSENGELLGTGDANDRVKLWSVQELLKKARQSSDQVVIANPVAEFMHSSDVENLAFARGRSNEEILLATVSSEGEAFVWSVTDVSRYAAPYHPPDYRLQHDAKILTVSFSPDGKWIITGGADGTARVWGSADGQLVGIFRHQGPVVQAWMPSDDQILTVSRSSRVGKLGHEPPLHVRHWGVSSSESEQISERDLEQLAARKVVDMRLEVMHASDFSSEP
ncbi:MAG: NACHT and WD repeat domain-containing protein [Candidatus Paceibacterota bacterium]